MMENAKQKKPRTIQMKYPAPYAQSWTDATQPTGPSTKKSRLSNANPSTHAPFSHSWANERSERADERATKRARRKTFTTRGGTQIVYPLPFSKFGASSERKLARPRKSNAGARRPPVKPVEVCCGRQRPDPTAPHLKYGLFPPKRASAKGQAQVLTAPEAKSRSSTADHSSKKDNKKVKGQKGQAAEGGGAPLFVFRALDPRYTRQLSVSAPTHLDIRPRRAPASPPPRATHAANGARLTVQ